MTFIQELRNKISNGDILEKFTRDDLKPFFNDSKINELSNYDKKNEGSSNKNRKVLTSIEKSGIRYYSFEKI